MSRLYRKEKEDVLKKLKEYLIENNKKMNLNVITKIYSKHLEIQNISINKIKLIKKILKIKVY